MNIKKSNRIDLVRELDQQLFKPDQVLALNFTQEWWLVYDGRKVVGYAGLDLDLTNEEAFLCRCGVLPEARGRGLQKKLLKIREDYAKEVGIKVLWTYTSTLNPKSMNSLISAGYRTYIPYDDDEGEFVYWQKDL